jgi:hypothetical protein
VVTSFWIDGCELHAFNFGGMALPGGRQILVCMARYGWMLGSSTNLYVVDLVDPDRRERTFFAAPDNGGYCGWNQEHEKEPSPLVFSHIDKI